MTPSGIEPATFRFVTQHLNHCAAAVPMFNYNQSYFHVFTSKVTNVKLSRAFILINASYGKESHLFHVTVFKIVINV